MTPAQTPSPRGRATRQALTWLAFGLAYFYLLAMYAVSISEQTRAPMFIWPTHGLALGALLVAPRRDWPVYLGVVLLDTVVVGGLMGATAASVAATAVINVSHPALVAWGLMRLAGPKVEIGTFRGLAAFLVGMVPLVAPMAFLDSAYSYLRYDGRLHQIWSITFFATALGVLLTTPLILAWNRRGYRRALAVARERWPELLVLFGVLFFTANFVFEARPQGSSLVPPQAYFCAPFLIWAALRFGLRAATVGVSLLGIIWYWHMTHDFVLPTADIERVRQDILNLQGFLAVIVVTTLFAAALVVERAEAIRETEDWRLRHERVIRASASLLYDLDPVSGIVMWDGDMQAVIGTTPAQVSTWRQWLQRVHDDDRLRLNGLREDLIAGRLSHMAAEYRFRRDDGEYVTLGMNAYRVADASAPGRRRITGFVKDVSEKVRADEDRVRLEAQLRQAEKMQAVGHLAGGIAHDFNNILGAILGYGELAQAKAKDGDLRRYIDTIMHAGNRAKSLVTQILSYSRAEGGEKLPVIVAPIAEEVCELIRGSSPASLRVDFHGEAQDAAVLGDPTRLHQLLMNVCSNAAQAMGGAGELVVAVDAERVQAPRKVRSGDLPSGEYVRITVSDTGHGIAPEVIDRIFEPFFTTKPAGQGTGLGLALVQAVVSEHRGHIDVSSALGRGTTFTVWLPRTEREPGAGDSGPEPAPQGRGEVVLAVDDEPEVLAALEEMLASLGYEPAGFRDSREALAAFRADPGRFEALVSDEVMPGLTGTQLAIELRKLNPALPILIASGFGGSGFETRALSAGVNRVLKKPYRMAEIGEVLAGFFAAKG